MAVRISARCEEHNVYALFGPFPFIETVDSVVRTEDGKEIGHITKWGSWRFSIESDYVEELKYKANAHYFPEVQIYSA